MHLRGDDDFAAVPLLWGKLCSLGVQRHVRHCAMLCIVCYHGRQDGCTIGPAATIDTKLKDADVGSAEAGKDSQTKMETSLVFAVEIAPHGILTHCACSSSSPKSSVAIYRPEDCAMMSMAGFK
ncbi:hypothetical protein MRB53_040242 [Persea americana]|nr:hypothetical protein MRB53_040242 [Persea americana]